MFTKGFAGGFTGGLGGSGVEEFARAADLAAGVEIGGCVVAYGGDGGGVFADVRGDGAVLRRGHGGLPDTAGAEVEAEGGAEEVPGEVEGAVKGKTSHKEVYPDEAVSRGGRGLRTVG